MKRLLLTVLPLLLIIGCSKELKNKSSPQNYDGLLIDWNKNGQKKSEGTYKDGKEISKKEWNEDGSVME